MQKYCLIAALALLYLTSLGGVGFIGPDEPRYASIGRAMAQTGDWITPKLDGQAWFEKPPLLYWTTGAANRLGFSDEWAARLPVALMGLAFLIFFYGTLEREFSARVALTGTAILGTSAGWVALSFAAVTDLPMAAAFNAAMLVALFGPQALGARGTGGREGRYKAQGYVAGFFLGLAVLAKGFPPLVLIAPVFLVARGKRLRMMAACVATAGPWYLLCYGQNGAAFWNEFFWKHHVARFLSPELEHVQPWWYYFPILLAGLFPWTPLVALIARRRSLEDERVRFLLVFLGIGVLFFSSSTNKLPAYILPLLPAMAIVMAVAVDKLRAPGLWLAACAVLLAAIPTVAGILPDALASGISRVDVRWSMGWLFLLPALAVWWLARDDPDQQWSDRRKWAALVVALAAVLAVQYLKSEAFPAMDQKASVRAFWRANRNELAAACLDNVKRTWVYQLNYYEARAARDCREGDSPRIVNRGAGLAIE
ncbi:MAG: glycosyltransferase family 39 protein [Acidobacteriota bacterium]